MSESSYLYNRSLGVAGPNTGTCFVQAFDRITPEAEVSTYTYREYSRYMGIVDKYSGSLHANSINSSTATLYGMVADDLGGFTLDAMVFEHAHRARRIGRVLNELIDNDMRPIIDLSNRSGDIHCVGVTRTREGLFKLVGYGVPSTLRSRPVTAAEVEPFVRIYGRLPKPFWPFQARNISALPAPTITRRGRPRTASAGAR